MDTTAPVATCELPTAEDTAFAASAVATWASFTPDEQSCIAGKIRKLRDEGKPQDQSIAIAIQHCAPEKAQKDSAFSAAPRILGGQYRAEQNPDGTWNVFDVPIFSAVGETAKGPARDAAWLRAAVERHAVLARAEYIAPLHVRHHGDGDRVEPAGKLLPRRVGALAFAGAAPVPTIFADLLGVPPAVFAELDRGALPYLSVEIARVRPNEFASAALLPDEAPFFQYPLVTVGEKRAAAGAEADAGTKRFRAGAVVAAYSVAVGDAYLFSLRGAAPGGATLEKDMKMEAGSDPLEAARAKLAEVVDAILKDLSALAEKIQALAAEVGAKAEAVEKEPAEEAPNEALPPAPGEAMMRATADAKRAAVADAKLAALEKRITGFEQTAREREAVRSAVAELQPYGGTEADAVEQYKLGGEPGLRAYVAAWKQAGVKDPTTFAAGFAPPAPDAPEVQAYAQAGPDVLALARRNAAVFAGAPRVVQKLGLAAYLAANVPVERS